MTEIQPPQPALALLVQALEDIIEPFAYIERTLPEGYRLDGQAALQQINSREFYTRIAKEALAAHRAAVQAPEGGLAAWLTDILPHLPVHPEPHTHTWTALEARAIERYGADCARAALAAPAPQAAPAQRSDWWGRTQRAVLAVEAMQAAPVALTDEQILNALRSITNEPPVRLPPGWVSFARAIEAAHGIPAPQTKEQP